MLTNKAYISVRRLGVERLAHMITTRNGFKVPTHATALLFCQKLLALDLVAGSGILVPDPVNV